jgi:ribokinase
MVGEKYQNAASARRCDMSQAQVCVVGSLNMDLVMRTPSLPMSGQTILGGPFHMFAGGKGANQAIAAARAGAQVWMVGCVGDDSHGKALCAALEAEGVDSAYVLTRTNETTGVAMIAVDQNSNNTIIVAPGANFALTPEDVQQAAEVIAAADVMLVQLEIPLPAVQAAVTIARQAQTKVVLNPAPAQELSNDLLAAIDVLVPNEVEAAMLSGHQPEDWYAAEAVARALRQQGAETVVITLGELGALLIDSEQEYRQEAFAVQAIDTTAAGDAFLGAFAVALADGCGPQESLRRGAAAGALATTVVGAQPSLPSRAAIETLLQQGS